MSQYSGKHRKEKSQRVASKKALTALAVVCCAGTACALPRAHAQVASAAPESAVQSANSTKIQKQLADMQQSKIPMALTPAAPSSVRVKTSQMQAEDALSQGSGYRRVTVTWNSVKGADMYVVYASSHEDFGFKPIAVTKKTSVSKDVCKGIKLYYKVQTVRNKAISSLSDWASITSGYAPKDMVLVTGQKKKASEGTSFRLNAQGTGAIRFASQNAAIASINNFGKVDAQRPGKTVLLAKTDSGAAKEIPVTVKEQKIRIPDFTGLTGKEAKLLAKASGIRVSFSAAYMSLDELQDVFGSDIFYGEIGVQSVSSGKKVKAKDASVKLVIIRPDLSDKITADLVSESGQADGSDENSNGSGSAASKKLGGEFVWPCPGNLIITSSFGHRASPGGIGSTYHQGIDIGAGMGQAVVAAADGTVCYAGIYGGYGNCVMVDHGNGIKTIYGHLSKITCMQGQKVSAGTVIGKVGSTGVSTGPHLHFGVSVDGQLVNPSPYLFGENGKTNTATIKDIGQYITPHKKKTYSKHYTGKRLGQKAGKASSNAAGAAKKDTKKTKNENAGNAKDTVRKRITLPNPDSGKAPAETNQGSSPKENDILDSGISDVR
jgi:murein DD-endopeptidase MepM/ murein hydrolase activator NlpD